MITALAGGVLFSGCVTVPPRDSPSNATHSSAAMALQGEWVVENIAGSGVIDDSRATLFFHDDGRLSGNASCNRLLANYTVKGHQLTITHPGLSMMACTRALMNQERRLADVLAQVTRYEVDDTAALILTTRSGARIIARKASR